jgi:hypothetical protein
MVHGRLAIVYCTARQTVTLDLSLMAGPVTVRWYDPTNGHFTEISKSVFANKGLQQFTTPETPHLEYDTENTSESSNDWVLVIEAA